MYLVRGRIAAHYQEGYRITRVLLDSEWQSRGLAFVVMSPEKGRCRREYRQQSILCSPCLQGQGRDPAARGYGRPW
jgi:hypothetical protein